jgi:signal transduction histidine kinase
MSDWSLQIPHRGDRDAPIADAMDAAHALPAEERPVIRAVLAELAVEFQANTVGDALDLLDRASPEARRELLDRARVSEGLPTTAAADARRKAAAATASLPSPRGPWRDPAGRAQAICAVPGCRNAEFDGATGNVLMTPARRWHCAEHRDLAATGDMEPYTGPRYGFNASGAFVDLDELDRERAREQERERRREARQKVREAEQRAAAAQAAEDKRAERARLSREGRWQFPWGNS